MHEMHEEWEIREACQVIWDLNSLEIMWVWSLEIEESVWEVKGQVSVERDKKMKSEITLKLFEKNVFRWKEDLSSTNSRQINLSRCCWESVDDKNTSMDRSYREAIGQTENILMDREAIKTNSRKFWWIEDAIKSIEKRSPRVLIDS